MSAPAITCQRHTNGETSLLASNAIVPSGLRRCIQHADLPEGQRPDHPPGSNRNLEYPDLLWKLAQLDSDAACLCRLPDTVFRYLNCGDIQGRGTLAER